MFLNLSSFSSSANETPIQEEKPPLRSTSPLYFSRTPYFYLQKDHRLLNAKNSKDEHAKRLSQTNVQPFRDYNEDFEFTGRSNNKKLTTKSPIILDAKNRLLRGKSGFTDAVNRSKFQIPARRPAENKNEYQDYPRRRSNSGKLVSFKDIVDRLNSQPKTNNKASRESSPIHSNSPKVGPKAENMSGGSITRNKSSTIGARSHAERMRTMFRKSNTVRYSPNRKTFKSEATTPMLGNIIRRKSCYCSDCGGMSEFEKKHMNIAIAPARSYRYQEDNSVSSCKSTGVGLGLAKSPSYKFDFSPTKEQNDEDIFSILDQKQDPKTPQTPLFINLPKKGHRKSPSEQREETCKEHTDKVRIVRKKVPKLEKRNTEVQRKKTTSPSPANKDKMSPKKKEMATVYNLTPREDIAPFMLGVHKKSVTSPTRHGSRALSSRDSSVGRRRIGGENYENLTLAKSGTGESKQDLDSESTQSLSAKSKLTASKMATREKSPDFLPKLNDPVKLANFYFNIVKVPKAKKLDPKTPTQFRDKGIKSTYKIGDNITTSLNKIITGAMNNSHLKARPSHQGSTQNFTDYMLPVQSARDYTNDPYRMKERPEDPYSMASLSFQSPTAARAITQDLQPIEEQRVVKTDTATSPRPLVGFKVKPVAGVTPSPLSDRSHKSRTPVPGQRNRGVVEGNNRNSQEGQCLEILGIDKLKKAYVAMGNRGSVKKQRSRVE